MAVERDPSHAVVRFGQLPGRHDWQSRQSRRLAGRHFATPRQRPSVASYGIEDFPECRATSAEIWLVRNEAIERACFGELTQRPLIEAGASREVLDRCKRPSRQCPLENLSGFRSETVHRAHAQPNG